jgi:hypothetical protein
MADVLIAELSTSRDHQATVTAPQRAIQPCRYHQPTAEVRRPASASWYVTGATSTLLKCFSLAQGGFR